LTLEDPKTQLGCNCPRREATTPQNPSNSVGAKHDKNIKPTSDDMTPYSAGHEVLTLSSSLWASAASTPERHDRASIDELVSLVKVAMNAELQE
jgi:hypothetical protein